MEMEVDIPLPFMSFQPFFVKQDICTIIHNNRILKALIYFSPKYTLDDKDREELYSDLQKVALVGGDIILSWGHGKPKKQVMYLRCPGIPSSIIYTMVAKSIRLQGP
jgi:hypothetical protein